MANATRNVSVSKSAYVKAGSPNSAFSTNANAQYIVGAESNSRNNKLFFGLNSWPSSLKHQKLIDMKIRLYMRVGSSDGWVQARICDGSFTASAVTYNNQPEDVARIGNIDNTLGVSVGSWGEVWVPNDQSGDATKAYRTQQLINSRGFSLGESGYLSASDLQYLAKIVLSNGSSAPYVQVTYDDANKVLSKVSLRDYLPSNLKADVTQTVSWVLEKASSSEYCAVETWVQTSAVFYWRIAGASSWNAINVSGSATSLSIPAKTFPVGNQIEYYVQAADEDGTVSQTSVQTVTACASTITKVSAPTGSVDPRDTQSFSWKFNSSAGDYEQQSAALKWKKSTDSAWNTINASGTTKSLTVPANTFPTGATIQWYLQGTDDVDHESNTQTYSFSTISSQVSADTCPSGNNNDIRIPIGFVWHLSNNFTQRSAVLYWKKSTDATWNAINITGSTTSVSVPAYTFPAGFTIQWYISATDTIGVTTQTSTASFNTAAAAVTATGFPSGSNIDTREAIEFSWTITGTLGEYNQRSAKFYWKKSTASAWNSIAVNSGTKSLTVPANTFPTGSTVQWYLEATDASGTVTTSAQKTFNTVTTKITAETYPSGNSVDFGSPLVFSWIFKSNNGNYGQTSASLFWRASTSDEWSEISATGSTQRLTVPAYTFPSNSTIQWYLEGTDVGGTVSTTSTMSFKTVSPQITPQNCPTSGYADPRDAITFSWFFSTGSSNYPQQSANFYWRISGTQNWTNVPASGSTQSVTIPANTFPLQSDIEWKLTGTDTGGTYSETEVFSFSTAASTAYAVCKEPVGRAEDGTKPITLRWIVQNEDGSAATRTIVKWKLPTESQSEWHQIVDTNDPITEYTLSEGFFNAGPVEWMVIAYNRDSVAGPDSRASFVCIAAPDPPSGLTATAVPLTEIHWQSSGQEAYEICIDGMVVESGFGSNVYSYKVKEPLPDGSHTITVRIQGSYSLWSNKAETQIFVENEPKDSITLTGSFDVDAALFWEFDGEDEPETVAIYRDGVWIGTATGMTDFVDRYVLGEHEYRVEYWFEDGNYTRSGPTTGSMDCETVKIAELSGSPWLDLRLSDSDNRVQGFRRYRTNAMQHITAAVYPVLEQSSYEDLTGSFECAFADRIGAAEFERLFGKVVILKSREGSLIIGGLTEMEKKVSAFYITYSFSIQQIHWEDFVNHDAND